MGFNKIIKTIGMIINSTHFLYPEEINYLYSIGLCQTCLTNHQKCENSQTDKNCKEITNYQFPIKTYPTQQNQHEIQTIYNHFKTIGYKIIRYDHHTSIHNPNLTSLYKTNNYLQNMIDSNKVYLLWDPTLHKSITTLIKDTPPDCILFIIK